MIKTIYECDKCGRSWETEGSTVKLTLGIEVVRYKGTRIAELVRHTSSGTKISVDWCGKCCDDFGIVLSYATQEASTSPPTFEDLLTEIIEQIVEEKIEKDQ